MNRFKRRQPDAEHVLLDAVEVAVDNIETPELQAETRLRIVAGVLRTALVRYRQLKEGAEAPSQKS